MELRDLGGALRRQKLSVLLILVITGLVVTVALRLAPTTDPTGSVAATDEASLVVPATLSLPLGDGDEPPETSGPDRRVAILLGVLVVCLLAAATSRARRKDTVDNPVAVERATSAPMLARVSRPREPTTLPALSAGTQAAAVFRHLRLAIEARAGRRQLGVVVVAGVTAGDVNVWLGANLAIALAEDGRRVLLVDGRMGHRFGTPGANEPDTPGLYDVLTGTPLADALSPGPTVRLTVLPSGPGGLEPQAALVERRFAKAMSVAQKEFDVVVVLAPPLDLGGYAGVMASAGSLLLTVPEGHVTADDLRAQVDRIRSAGALLLGVVLVGRRPERVPV